MTRHTRLGRASSYKEDPLSKVNIHIQTVTSANILSVAVGTNCPMGGDAGHGGRTVLRLSNEAGTDMRCCIDDGPLRPVQKIEIVLSGDTECETFIQALEFALVVLRTKSILAFHSSTEENIE